MTGGIDPEHLSNSEIKTSSAGEYFLHCSGGIGGKCRSSNAPPPSKELTSHLVKSLQSQGSRGYY